MRTLLLAGLLFPALACAAECTVRSGPATNAVIELYTSEGCSSCPPADRWLSGFAAPARVEGVVPLAFHVDYWDHIGWKDVFASAASTERQRTIQRASGARYVYTPQVVAGGRDLRSWRGSGWKDAVAAIRQKRAPLTIELAVRSDATRGIEVTTTSLPMAGVQLEGRELVTLVALTQDGLQSRVTAGENRGERLAHDFVVREFAVHRGTGRVATRFRPAAGWNLAHMSVAAFVQDTRTGEILQALSTRAC